MLQASEGLTWGWAGGDQLVLTAMPFGATKGQWNPGDEVGRINESFGQT